MATSAQLQSRIALIALRLEASTVWGESKGCTNVDAKLINSAGDLYTPNSETCQSFFSPFSPVKVSIREEINFEERGMPWNGAGTWEVISRGTGMPCDLICILNLKSATNKGASLPLGCWPAPILWETSMEGAFESEIKPRCCNFKKKASANCLQRGQGYSASVLVEKTNAPVFTSCVFPHGRWGCDPSQTWSRFVAWKFNKKAVFFNRLPPYMQLWTHWNLHPDGRSLKNDVSHIHDLWGFSQMNGMPKWQHLSMTILVKRYSLLASFTFIAFKPRSDGNPSGWLRDLNGGGAGFDLPLASIIGISLARDEVPQGGANITASAFPSSNHCMTRSWFSFLHKSTFETGPLTLLLSMIWSSPKASPPNCINAAVTPAVPEKMSSKKTILLESEFAAPSVWKGGGLSLGCSSVSCLQKCRPSAKTSSTSECFPSDAIEDILLRFRSPTSKVPWRFRVGNSEIGGPSPTGEIWLPSASTACLCSQEDLCSLMNACFFLQPFLQHRCIPFLHLSPSLQDPKLNAKQKGLPSSSQGIPPSNCFGIGVRRNFFTFAASAFAFLIFSSFDFLISVSPALGGISKTWEEAAACLFGIGINIHLISGLASTVFTWSSEGRPPVGLGWRPPLASSARRTCSSLSAAAIWLRVTWEKPSKGSFLSSLKKALMISSWTSKDMACAISYATPLLRSALWTSNSVAKFAIMSGSFLTALIAPEASVFQTFKSASSFTLFTSCDLEVHLFHSTYLMRPSSTHCTKALMRWCEGSSTFAMTNGVTRVWRASSRCAISGGGSFLGASCSLASTFLRRSAAVRAWLSKNNRLSFGASTWSSLPRIGVKTP